MVKSPWKSMGNPELGIQTAQSTMHLALAFAKKNPSSEWFRETDSNDSAMDVI